MMMTETGKEYARALFELAVDTGKSQEVMRGLEFMRALLRETPDLAAFCDSPGISKAVRINTIKSAIENEVAEYVTSFVCILVEKNEIALLPECIEEYAELYADANHVAHAFVKSAVELTAEEKVKLMNKLQKISKSTVRIEYAIDESLLGGMVVDMEGMIFDGSLKNKLQSIKEVMSE